MTINDLSVNPGGFDRDAFLEDWHWLLPKDAKPVMITVLGDVFAQDPNGAVHFLDTCEGSTETVAEDGQQFQTLLKDPNFVLKHFHPRRVQELKAHGLTPNSGQCYSFKHPPVLGGKDELDNYEVCDAAVHMSLAGQIHQQAKELPDGAVVSKVNINTAGSSKPWWKLW